MDSSSRKRKDPPSYRTAVRSGVRRRLFAAPRIGHLGQPIRKYYFGKPRGWRGNGGGRRRRFRRGRRRGLGISRAKLVRALAVVNHKVFQSAQGVLTGGSSTISGRLCNWFSGTGATTSGSGALPNTVETLNIRDLFHIYETEFSSFGATRQSIKFYIRKWRIEHELTNMSTGYVTVRAYYCKMRSDVPVGSSLDNHVTMLERGLRQELFSGALSASGQLARWSTTPFMAPLFCSYVKIYKKKQFQLESGQKRTFFITDSKTRLVNLARMFTTDEAGAVPSAMTQLLSHVRGAKFILFQVTGQLLRPLVPTSESEASVGNQHVHLASSWRLTYSTIMDQRPDYSASTALNYVAPLATDRLILEDTDAVGIITNA